MRRLPCEGCNDEFAELDAAVIALEDEGSGFAFLGVDGDGGESFNLPFDDFFPVEHDLDVAADEADIEGLPLAGLAAGILARGDAAVEGAVAVRIGLLAVVFEDWSVRRREIRRGVQSSRISVR
jgi:hypothetical protein